MKLPTTAILMLSFCAVAQPQKTDFSTLDNLIEALYSSISGPAGERDWDFFQQLYEPNAIMGAMVPGPGGASVYRAMTPVSYVEANGPSFEKSGFWEEEIGRNTLRYGDLAHIFSAYEFRLESADGEVRQRGINSIQAVFEEGRWWIVSIQWNPETPDNPIPGSMITKDQ